jgi:hypothetical protein
VLVACLAACALPICGCGKAETESGSARDYRQRVNAICATAANRSDAVIEHAFADLYGNDLPANPTAEELQAFYAAILPAADESAVIIRGMLDDVRAVPAPEELSDDAGTLWDAFEKRLRMSIRRIEAAASNPAKAIELDVDDTFPFDPENERAARLGLTACSVT